MKKLTFSVRQALRFYYFLIGVLVVLVNKNIFDEYVFDFNQTLCWKQAIIVTSFLIVLISFASTNRFLFRTILGSGVLIFVLSMGAIQGIVIQDYWFNFYLNFFHVFFPILFYFALEYKTEYKSFVPPNTILGAFLLCFVLLYLIFVVSTSVPENSINYVPYGILSVAVLMSVGILTKARWGLILVKLGVFVAFLFYITYAIINGSTIFQLELNSILYFWLPTFLYLCCMPIALLLFVLVGREKDVLSNDPTRVDILDDNF